MSCIYTTTIALDSVGLVQANGHCLSDDSTYTVPPSVELDQCLGI